MCKGNGRPVDFPLEIQKACRRVALPIFNLRARWICWSEPFPYLFNPKNLSGAHSTEGRLGPWTGLGICGKRKISRT